MRSPSSALAAFMDCQLEVTNSLIDITAKQMSAAADVRSLQDLPALYSKQWQLADALQNVALNYALAVSRLPFDLQDALSRRGARHAKRMHDLTENAANAVDKTTYEAATGAIETAKAVEKQTEDFAFVTKEALYDIAKDTAVEGRSTMNKEQLQDAIADVDMAPLEELTRDELYQKAQLLGIEGRSKMSRDQLLEAIRTTLGR